MLLFIIIVRHGLLTPDASPDPTSISVVTREETETPLGIREEISLTAA